MYPLSRRTFWDISPRIFRGGLPTNVELQSCGQVVSSVQIHARSYSPAQPSPKVNKVLYYTYIEFLCSNSTEILRVCSCCHCGLLYLLLVGQIAECTFIPCSSVPVDSNVDFPQISLYRFITSATTIECMCPTWGSMSGTVNQWSTSIDIEYGRRYKVFSCVSWMTLSRLLMICVIVGLIPSNGTWWTIVQIK